VILAAAWYVGLDDLKATVSSPSMRYAMRMSITSVTKFDTEPAEAPKLILDVVA